jgi:predicted nucleic acid-binding protein
MSRIVVLDAEAVSALAGSPSGRQRVVRAALEVAERLDRDVVVPALVLAELYRGAARSRGVDAFLARETGIRVRDTDRMFARLVGGILQAARAGTDLIVDAHVVAAAVESGGGVVLTADPDDLERLAGRHRNVQVVDIT